MATPKVILEVRGFCKRFGDKVIHDNLDFTLHEGEVVSLIGGSGTGKSVFLRALIGLERADHGTIKYHGREISQLSEDAWNPVRIKIAYAFQHGALFDSMTVEENLLYPLDAHTKLSRAQKDKKIDEILTQLGLEKSKHLLPADLSGGMQKRAGLARALILEPEIILYDEPTAGLDPFNTKNIQDMINELKERGKGGILVTHDMPTAFATSERISLLTGGRIAVSGRVEDLRNNPLIEGFIAGDIDYGKAKPSRGE